MAFVAGKARVLGLSRERMSFSESMEVLIAIEEGEFGERG